MHLPTFFLLTILSLNSAASVLRDLDPKIVNGENAKPGEIPYQVSLQFIQNSLHFCGGSIINKNYVITVAHCVYGKVASNLKVVAGTTNLKLPNYETRVGKIIIHEKYHEDYSWINDIALLTVEKPFVKSTLIDFITLPSIDQELHVNDLATVSGWGKFQWDGPRSFRLQRVDIAIADHEYCKHMYKLQGHNIHESQVCAYDPYEPKGSCYGDSGGPLTIDGTLVGLVSWAMGCARTDYPTVYTRVVSYMAWIKSHAV